jgi:hypothetical protein
MQRRDFLRLGALTGMVVASRGAARAEAYVGKVEYKGWKDALRLSNGTVEVFVVPGIGGRVMRYGYVGGPNLLWENKTVAGKPIPVGEWPNTGGDKIWPWPQDDWPQLHPKGWPPPPESDQMAHVAEVVGADTVRLTSPIIIPYGVRIVRDIRVAPRGTQVFLTTRMEQMRDGRTARVAPWAVTQVNAAPWTLARLLPEADKLEAPGFRPASAATEFKAVTKLPEGFLKVERPGTKAVKLFTEADLLATLQDGILFSVRHAPTAPADNAGRAYQPGDRAQIYCHSDDKFFADNGMPTYTELEMTAPLAVLKKGETVTLDQIWELRRVPEAARTPEGVASILKTY